MSSRSAGGVLVDVAALASLVASCMAGGQLPRPEARPSGWAARVHADLRAIGGEPNELSVAARARLVRLARWSLPHTVVVEQLVLPGLEAPAEPVSSVSAES